MADRNDAPEIDVAEVERLIAALERDLDRIRGDSEEVRRLREEVSALKAVVHGPPHERHRVRDALHGVRGRLDKALDEAVYEGMEISRYAAEIGRILGLG